MKKKNIILLGIAVSLYMIISQNYCFAQGRIADYRDMIQLGVKVGTNYSNVYDTKGEEFKADPKFGLATGVFVAIPIGKYLGFQPEILISQKGFHATGKFLGILYDYTRTTTYVDVPLLFSLKPTPFLNLVAGPQYSYLLKQKDDFDGSFFTIQQEEEFNNDDLRMNTLCFLGGLDIDLNNFVIGTRMGWDLFDNNKDNTTTTPRYKNVWFQATVGYRLVNN
ncbi:MAG: PorT family protein [Bacteroidales bacterium]|nr:PorT family protein [Bacteroidales bacterium]